MAAGTSYIDVTRWDHRDLQAALRPSTFFEYVDSRYPWTFAKRGVDCAIAWRTTPDRVPSFCLSRVEGGDGECWRCGLIYEHAIDCDMLRRTCGEKHAFPHASEMPDDASSLARFAVPWAWCWLNQIQLALHHNDPNFVADVMRQPHVWESLRASHAARKRLLRIVAGALLADVREARRYCPAAVADRIECLRFVIDYAVLWYYQSWVSDLFAASERLNPGVYLPLLVREYGAVRVDIEFTSEVKGGLEYFQAGGDGIHMRCELVATRVFPDPLVDIICQYASIAFWTVYRHGGHAIDEVVRWRWILRSLVIEHPIDVPLPPGILYDQTHVVLPDSVLARSRAWRQDSNLVPGYTAADLHDRWRYQKRFGSRRDVFTPWKSMMPSDEDLHLQCQESFSDDDDAGDKENVPPAAAAVTVPLMFGPPIIAFTTPAALAPPLPPPPPPPRKRLRDTAAASAPTKRHR